MSNTNTVTEEANETAETFQPATLPGCHDRDPAYEEWLDDCERNAAAEIELEIERMYAAERAA